MNELTIDWGGLSFNSLSSSEPLETELTPTTAYTGGWTPSAVYGMVATDAENTAAYFTVTWQPRRAGGPLPFHASDLLVGAGEDDPEPETPQEPGTPEEPTRTTPGATVPAPAAAPATGGEAQAQSQVRPRTGDPRIAVSRTRLRTGYLIDGLAVRVDAPADATVEAVLLAAATRRVNGRPRTRTEKISATAARRVGKGRARLVLKPSRTGRRLLAGRRTDLAATLVVEVTYADREVRRFTRPVTIKAPK